MPTLPDDGPLDFDVLTVDRYLDALLAGGTGRDAATGDPDVPDPRLRDAADVLRRSLVRVHPSFQFEERLSARLSAMATERGGGSRLGALIQFRPLRHDPADGGTPADRGYAADGSPAVGDAAPLVRAQPAARRSAAVRPILIGGAITSAALSLAGVAWVARRAVRTPALAELEGLL